jgi:hypothetical protein
VFFSFRIPKPVGPFCDLAVFNIHHHIIFEKRKRRLATPSLASLRMAFSAPHQIFQNSTLPQFNHPVKSARPKRINKMKLVAGTCLLLFTAAVSATSSSNKPKQLRRTREKSRETLDISVEAVDPALEVNHVPHVVRDSRIVGGQPASAGSYPYFGRYCKILSARGFHYCMYF